MKFWRFSSHLLDVTHELHKAWVVVRLRLIDRDYSLEVLVLVPVSIVLFVCKLPLRLRKPLRVLHAYLLHRVVHELLAEELPHHPVDDLLVVLRRAKRVVHVVVLLATLERCRIW